MLRIRAKGMFGTTEVRDIPFEYAPLTPSHTDGLPR